MVVFEDDALARLRPVRTRNVRDAHPREQEAEGDQENYQDLWTETAGVETHHRLS